MANIIPLPNDANALLSPEGIAQNDAIRKRLSEIAKERRRRKTAKGIRKRREIGDGKSIEYVDRAEYQKWLDDTFPGWSVQVVNVWTDDANIGGKVFPICFSVSVQLIVNDNGVARQVPGVGTSTISVKEIDRPNTQLMKFKYSIALTDAIKNACGWLGSFWDLRVDEEERERSISPPTAEHQARFEEIIKSVATNHQSVTKEIWAKQTLATADRFLVDLHEKVEKLKNLSTNIQG